MATTAQTVFDLAIKLMNENDDRTGQTQTQDTLEYQVRALAIMNVLRHQLYRISDTWEGRTDGKRPVCPEIRSMEQFLDLDDTVAQGIMPYGLAARLLVDDNANLASYFQQCYDEEIFNARQSKPCVWDEIR